MDKILWESIERLAPLAPNFVSVTYGAGGSTRERTHATVKRILAETPLTPAAHLTCVAATREEIDAIVRNYHDAGVRHIVALRGDPDRRRGHANTRRIRAATRTPPIWSPASSASPAISRSRCRPIRRSIPTARPWTPTSTCSRPRSTPGATRAITQFFFENDLYFRYLDRVRARGIDIPIVPGILPVQNFKAATNFAARAGASVPAWLAERFHGLDNDPATRKLIAAAVAAEQVLDLVDRGVTNFHFYTMNRADLVYAICHLLGLRPAAQEVAAVSVRECQLRPTRLNDERILVLDGAMGTMIQALKLDEEGYRGARFDAWNREVRGNNDLLNLSRPDAVRDIHLAYFRAGADIVSTNTFSSTAIAQADYGMEGIAYELNHAGATLAREAAQLAEKEDGRRRFVAGALGPTNRTASISPDVSNPGFRAISFDQLREAYGEQVAGLIDGGADLLLIETIFDTLNAKAAIYAIAEVCDERGHRRAGDDLRHHHRPLRPPAVGADAGGVLEFGAARQSGHHRAQLRARRQRNARAYRRARPPRRHLRLRLSECRPAERIRLLRRKPGIHGRAARRIRRRRSGQCRRRLLRHHARAHRGDRQGGGRQDAARRSPKCRGSCGCRGWSLHAHAGNSVRQCRRAHQRHRLGQIPQADHRRRLCQRARASRASRSRTARR